MELAAAQSDTAPSRADFSTLSSSRSWRQRVAQPTAKRSCQAPMVESLMLRHGQAMSRRSQHPSKHPGSGQTGLSPASQRPTAVGALTTLGAVFRAHGSRRRPFPAESGSLRAGLSQLKQISTGNIRVSSEMLKIVFFLISPFFNLTPQSFSFLNTYLIQASTIKIIFIMCT